MNHDAYQQPATYPPPKKDNTLKIVFLGLGCFGLIAVACIGGLGFAVYQGAQAIEKGIGMINENPGYLEARQKLKDSDPLASVLGDPVEVGSYTNIQADESTSQDGHMRFEYDVPVSGPNASGTANIVVEGPPLSDDNWSIKTLEVRVNGEVVPLEGEGLDISPEGE